MAATVSADDLAKPDGKWFNPNFGHNDSTAGIGISIERLDATLADDTLTFAVPIAPQFLQEGSKNVRRPSDGALLERFLIHVSHYTGYPTNFTVRSLAVSRDEPLSKLIVREGTVTVDSSAYVARELRVHVKEGGRVVFMDRGKTVSAYARGRWQIRPCDRLQALPLYVSSDKTHLFDIFYGGAAQPTVSQIRDELENMQM